MAGNACRMLACPKPWDGLSYTTRRRGETSLNIREIASTKISCMGALCGAAEDVVEWNVFSLGFIIFVA